MAKVTWHFARELKRHVCVYTHIQIFTKLNLETVEYILRDQCELTDEKSRKLNKEKLKIFFFFIFLNKQFIVESSMKKMKNIERHKIQQQFHRQRIDILLYIIHMCISTYV